jgi:hypothetical protein
MLYKRLPSLLPSKQKSAAIIPLHLMIYSSQNSSNKKYLPKSFNFSAKDFTRFTIFIIRRFSYAQTGSAIASFDN